MDRRAGVVVGVGGYASGPVVLAGSLLRRPTLDEMMRRRRRRLQDKRLIGGHRNRSY